MSDRLSPHGLGVTFAVLSAAFMLLLSIGAWTGFYATASQAMMSWMMWYNTSVGGTIAGVVECSVWGYFSGYVLAWVYNRVS